MELLSIADKIQCYMHLRSTRSHLLMHPTPYWSTLREETRRVVQEAEKQRSQELENRAKQEKVTRFSPVP